MAKTRIFLRLYPADLLTDEAFDTMSMEARGAYITFLCKSWMTKTPGVCPEQQLRNRAGCSALPEDQWNRIKSELFNAFEVQGEGPFAVWTQKRMVAEFERMEGDLRRQRKHRDKGVAGDAEVTPHVTQESRGRIKNQEARSKEPPIVPHGDVFEQVWVEYPRKVGKQTAVKAWTRLMANGQGYDPKTIWNGVERWRVFWETQKTEPQFIPHLATMLNQRRFLEEPQ